MKSKAPLSLMEQIIMILVFALASAVCLQAFSVANRISHRQEDRNQAVLIAQNCAEQLKYNFGDFEAADYSSYGYWKDDSFYISYDKTWQPVEKQGYYILKATPFPTGNPLLGSAEIQVLSGNNILFEINVAWQGVVVDERK